ncbi:hypothetical protein L6452_11478 [Arctium lappa]|uniref:Uncharacterized protein n=1 Tax=Arctium lappa TaxID=4217 RepID=A0ACB9DP10_ARCLA|nr:hypothetical protein L6452_11478 [Arctium lappa]
MTMESQIPYREAPDLPENVFIKDVITSETHHVASNQPAKKQTRQWAAWTRQEEESFFNALRQVGKNFEKITSRVQSKNKDQVRHYYYRLVRRMNKLLGPELSLDAKNSKDTNAAMLRWWSLLEKHSCKASKLHLKPRRFKIFLETLEHQLLKDRKKNIRKRPFHGENCSITPSHAVSNQGRACTHDGRINLVLVDSQSTQNLGSGKGSSLRRNASTCLDRNNCKGDLSPVKPARQRRRAGTASTAAYKRWEKAAIAGVSLVADAAAHLEQTSLDKLVDSVQYMQGEKSLDPVAKDMPCIPAFHQNMFSGTNIQHSMKLKLQLFPVDESIRRALEMDNHNPHLELTLSSRKKISSVLEHMNRKWGSSSIASGELTLLPYYAQSSNLMSCQKWTQDSILSAADVYAALGSPPVFRLRYGWFANADCRYVPLQEPLTMHAAQITNMNGVEVQNVDLTKCSQPPEHSMVPQDICTMPGACNSVKSLDHDDKLVSAGKVNSLIASSSDIPDKLIDCVDVGVSKNFSEGSDHASGMSWQRRDTRNGAFSKRLGHMDKGSHKNSALSILEWADSLTNISVSDLLLDVSHNINANGIGPPLPPGSQCLQQVPFSCDSFDAAIAAHVSKNLNSNTVEPTIVSSIWDAEETCDAFTFHKNNVLSEKTHTSKENCKQDTSTSLAPSGSAIEKLDEAEEAMEDHPAEVHSMDECQSDGNPEDGSAKDLRALTDMYWPESLGALEVDVGPCRYQSDDLILSDGLSRILSSSLDAFQNFSLFGLEQREGGSVEDDKIHDS